MTTEVVEKTEKEESEKTEIILEEYKLFVQMMDSNSNRRNQVNRFYLTVVASSYFVFPLVLKNGITNYYFLAWIGILGVVLCMVWFLTLYEYRTLNWAKFKVISDLEKRLPVQSYDLEYKYLKEKKYIVLSKFEQSVTIVLSIPYLILFFYALHKILFG